MRLRSRLPPQAQASARCGGRPLAPIKAYGPIDVGDEGAEYAGHGAPAEIHESLSNLRIEVSIRRPRKRREEHESGTPVEQDERGKSTRSEPVALSFVEDPVEARVGLVGRIERHGAHDHPRLGRIVTKDGSMAPGGDGG